MKLKKLLLTYGYDRVDYRELFRGLWPIWIFGGIFLLVFIWPKYDSYGECMYEWELEKNFAESQWPGQNDWRKKDKEAHLRCLDYAQHWEW